MGSMPIIQSVGIGGKNSLNDVKSVQTSLNQLKHLIPSTKSLVVDGKLGIKPELSKTVNAIMLFQKKLQAWFVQMEKSMSTEKIHKK